MDARELYINLLKRAVRNELYPPPQVTLPPSADRRDLALASEHLAYLRATFGSAVDRLTLTPQEVCRLWEALRPTGHTLCDERQLDNVRHCLEYVLQHGVAGDLIEAGAYRGGQCIFMRGLLRVYEVTDRKVFVADSFQGLPMPDSNRDVDDAIAFEFLRKFDRYAVNVEEVRRNFDGYGLLDEQVIFLEGWFEDTLRVAPIQNLAIMRLDGDFYDSTREALDSLYGKLSCGGFVIVDDYGLPVGCRRAVDEFRAKHGISAELRWVNGSTVFWQKS